jgi:hypothetical protein
MHDCGVCFYASTEDSNLEEKMKQYVPFICSGIYYFNYGECKPTRELQLLGRKSSGSGL